MAAINTDLNETSVLMEKMKMLSLSEDQDQLVYQVTVAGLEPQELDKVWGELNGCFAQNGTVTEVKRSGSLVKIRYGHPDEASAAIDCWQGVVLLNNPLLLTLKRIQRRGGERADCDTASFIGSVRSVRSGGSRTSTRGHHRWRGGRGGGRPKVKVTKEELDRELDEYFGRI